MNHTRGAELIKVKWDWATPSVLPLHLELSLPSLQVALYQQLRIRWCLIDCRAIIFPVPAVAH